MDFSPPFGAWLKARRKELGLSQAELAARARFSLAAVRKIEESARPASRALAAALIGPLGIPAEAQAAFAAFARGVDGQHPLNHLPRPLTPLLGREAEIAEIERALRHPDSRLLTLIGPPGVGKTRLAVQIAHDLQPSFADGAVFVSLAPVTEPGLIQAAIATALPLRGPISDEAIAAFFEARHALLILDNFEHLLEGAPAVTALLMRCPGLHVIVTSRSILGLSGERVIEVAPLAEDPAIQLFARQARAAKPSFALTSHNIPIIAEICRRLDGLPLAIELAAARSRMLTPPRLLARLSDHPGAQLELLTHGPRDWPERQRALEATIGWSYGLLDPAAQRCFRRLSVCAGGWTVEMAASLCVDAMTGRETAETAAEETLQILMQNSLVVESKGLDGGHRFYMLETLRSFARQRLEECGEGPKTLRRLTAFLNRLARAAEPNALKPNRLRWLLTLATERDNLRAALTWCRGPDGDLGMGLSLAGGIGWVVASGAQWNVQMPLADVRFWLKDIETRIFGLPEEMRASTLCGLSELLRAMGDTDGMVSLAPLIESHASIAGDDASAWQAELIRAYEHDLMRRDFPRAVPCYEALLRRGGGDPLRRALALGMYGRALASNGQPARAIAQIEEAVQLWESAGIGWAPLGGCVTALDFLAQAYSWAGDHARAEDAARRVLLKCAELGFGQGVQYASRIGAFSALALGRHAAFRAFVLDYFRVALPVPDLSPTNHIGSAIISDTARCIVRAAQDTLARQASALPGDCLALALDLVAETLRFTRDFASSARLYGAAWARREADGPLRETLSARIESARPRLLGDPILATAWEDGARMDDAAAVSFVLGLSPQRLTAIGRIRETNP